MKDDLLAYLDDILRSGRAIKAFVAGCTFEDYSSDELLRSSVPSLMPWTHFCSRRRSNKSIDSDKQ